MAHQAGRAGAIQGSKDARRKSEFLLEVAYLYIQGEFKAFPYMFVDTPWLFSVQEVNFYKIIDYLLEDKEEIKVIPSVTI